MSEKTLDEIMSERGGAVSETIETAPEAPASETTREGRARAESGRFAPKAGETTSEAQPVPAGEERPEPKGGTVPQQALHASRERERQARDENQSLRDQVQRLEGMMQALAAGRQEPSKPKEEPKPVDFWEDPQAFITQMLNPVQQQVAQHQEAFSQRQAVADHGKETVEAAYTAMSQALDADPNAAADYRRIMQSPHPYGELVNWHRNRTALAEIGNDPAAYRERLRQELMTELQQGQPPTTAAAPRLPGNFTQARSEGPRGGASYSGPKPLSEITKGSTA